MFPGYATAVQLHPGAGDFAALMELYENNYLRLRRLCPDLGGIEDGQVSVVEGASDLHLAILERTPYTTLLRLTYEFGSGGRISRQPDLRIRMFHDARQAEVVGRYCRRRGEGEVRLDAAAGIPGLACRWRHNRFLFKWLGFCLAQGHRFGSSEATTVATGALDSLS
ncbi:protein of unknown function DUF1249 [Thioalkalivibrio nitratireducens DSM 14787]|uniref:Cytoplasmic protein n=1 Tax=Thioalkalivibrio nitratireducens (strain DSM 14787 / UNIQEM 213 / ALEN2) TaxID=1255043 RepID=L0DU46_THIND|nr:DUF1249 domain-containing protein [Thioalkalivibrio nitratireducens]AGA33119.1 protein of unknown function DUF1249 [Thioalkalivibrio nitratireducens DSM 14787]